METQQTETKPTKATIRENAITRLQEILPPGSTVYCIVTSVARSGMSRRMNFYTFKNGKNGTPQKYFLTQLISEVLAGVSYTSKDWMAHSGLRVRGCGMDMGFHVVNNLSYILHGFPNEDRKAPGCPAGYTLKHEWL